MFRTTCEFICGIKWSVELCSSVLSPSKMRFTLFPWQMRSCQESVQSGNAGSSQSPADHYLCT